jgi:hypothetical protein
MFGNSLVLVHADSRCFWCFALAEMFSGCDENLLHIFFLFVECLVTSSCGLGKKGWQRRWTTFLVVLFEYRATISRGKAQGLAFIGCT